MNDGTRSLSIGVVIPGHNFARNLRWILEALLPQVLPNDRVVVVDDHSDRPVRERDLPPSMDADLVVLTGANGPGNRSAARNAGWCRCQTDLVLFLDGDMVPGPDYLATIRQLHGRESDIVVKGERFALSQARQLVGRRHCLRLVARRERWLAPEANSVYAVPVPASPGPIARTDIWYYAASNALSVERRLVESIGGWDEQYVGWGEEDMDFAYRLHLQGAGFVFPPPESLYAVHLDHPTPQERLDSLRSNACRFVAKFPAVYAIRWPAYEACGLSRDDFMPIGNSATGSGGQDPGRKRLPWGRWSSAICRWFSGRWVGRSNRLYYP